MSIGKKIFASIIGLVLIVVIVYGLFLMGGGATGVGGNRGGGGLASPSARTIITLTVWGGSAFITGFGLRDVIGRVVGTRQRNRSKAVQGSGH